MEISHTVQPSETLTCQKHPFLFLPKKIPLSPSKSRPPPLHDKSCCRSRHLTKISKKAGCLEKTKARPLHRQQPAGNWPCQTDSGTDLVAINPEDTSTRGGELPLCREKPASPDELSQWRERPCSKVSWEAKRGSPSPRQGLRTARNGAMCGLLGWRALGER